VTARGQLGLAPTRLDLEVAVDAMDLGAIQPYLLPRGQIKGAATAKLKVSGTVEPLAISAQGTAALDNLTVAEGERRLLSAERAEVTGLDYAWPATVSVDRLLVRKPWTLLDRTGGRHPLLELLTAAPRARRDGPRPAPAEGAARRERGPRGSRRPEPRAPEPPAPPAAGASDLAAKLQVKIRRAVVENGGLTIVDAGAGPAANVDIAGARLSVGDFTWPASGATRISLRAPMPSGGNLEARGELRLEVPSIDTRLVLDRVDFAVLQPLLPLRGRVGGQASGELQVKGTLAPLALSVAGKLAVAEASLGDGQRALVTVKGVDIAGIDGQWPAQRLRIQSLALREPWALVERDAGGDFPLLALITPINPPAADGVAPAASAAPAAPRAGALPDIEIGTFAIDNGFARFTDRTTTPTFVEEMSRLALTVRGLGTSPRTRSEVTLTARLSGGAQLELRGTTGPIGGPLFADAEGKLSGLPLNRLNPYVNRLVGWVARRGSLDATVRYRIREDRFEAENDLVIGQPELAPSRRNDEVRERVGVPLDLLVSLLKNARGEVRLSVPVTGSLSSRQVDLDDAVWDAIRKVAINVLALPVSWVGKIFYTPDSRIDTIRIWPVAFEPGTTRMQRGVDAHAARLATFMRQTPSVAFTVKAVLTVDDVAALRREAVRQRIEGLARESGQPDAAAAARLFAERFPGRPVPADLAAMVDELAKAEPPPDAALQALATRRVEQTRRDLESKGVDPTRLHASTGAVPVEGAGPGRVEFEMAPDAVPAR
jgi:hypothetical protein